MMHIRDASVDDIEALTAIQNATIQTTTGEWRDDPHPVAERRKWLQEQQAANLPVLVAVDDNAVVGFASYGPFRDNTKWPGFRFTVEHSVHVAEAAWGAGVGRRLMDELIARAVTARVHAMIGAIDSTNEGSIRFHERIGFVERGRLTEIGWKHDQWLDLVLMVRNFD